LLEQQAFSGDSLFLKKTGMAGRYGERRLNNEIDTAGGIIENCVLRNNTVGVHCDATTALLQDCVIQNNSYGVYNQYGYLQVCNCRFVDNGEIYANIDSVTFGYR
jgi:hypothetical protein